MKLNYSIVVHVLHEFQMDEKTFVRVVGDADNGCYEWLIDEDGKIEHSNCGYGDSTVALRDGLIKYHAKNPSAQSLASLAKGVPKNFSKAERERRKRRLAEARKKRWTNKEKDQP